MLHHDNPYTVDAVVSPFLVETIGISENTYEIYEELELNTYAIPVECRKYGLLLAS
jgi:hypothetical protein